MRGLVGCLSGVFLVAFACNAMAGMADMGVTVKGGTLGVGGELTVGLSEMLNVRVGGNYFTYTFDNVADDREGVVTEIDELDLEVDLQSVSLLLDLHPWNTPFRITGGVIFHNNEFAVTTDYAQRVEVGDRVYTVDNIRGTLTFENEVAPYIGIGYGNVVSEDSRWHLALDIGIMFHGDPQVDLSATANDPLLQSVLDWDIEQEIVEAEADTEDFTMYPVVSVGLSYRF